MNEKRGAPIKESEQKIRTNGLAEWQWKRIKKEAEKQGVPAAQHLRSIISSYFEVRDMVESIQSYSPTEEEDLKFEKLSKKGGDSP